MEKIRWRKTIHASPEIYSIKLHGDPKLGEGKPENQNHAIIFTLGEAVQTIDMNRVKTGLIIIFFLVLVAIFYTLWYKDK
ncbi:hypothetical protein ACSQ67_023754 [Phaseolus vulgaris]